LPTCDGWIAVSLARETDLEAVPAWVGVPLAGWSTDPAELDIERMTRAVADLAARRLVEMGALLGLAVGTPGEVRATSAVQVLHRHHHHRRADPVGHRPLVVDLSSLWAGPLCSALLAAGGADVVKVESSVRPDGMRRDPSGFFDLLNHGKRSVALDLTTDEGIDDLRCLLDAADVVIEGSRPRALIQLGVSAEELVAASSSKVWLSITGHGRSGSAAMRVGFGDDAAVAGGLVAWDTTDQPCFVGDAVADPLTGLVSAAAVSRALAAGGSWLLDVALSRVAAEAARGLERPAAVLDEQLVARPRVRPVTGPAAPLGAHTDMVLAQVRDG
jgi:hypothetical protein